MADRLSLCPFCGSPGAARSHGAAEVLAACSNVKCPLWRLTGMTVEMWNRRAGADLDDRAYLVWSNEHSAWWGPDECGYYTRLPAAGRYTRTSALAICIEARGGRRYNANPSEVPILLTDADYFWPDIPLAGWKS